MKGTLGSLTDEFFQDDLANEARHPGEEDGDRGRSGLGRHDEDSDRR